MADDSELIKAGVQGMVEGTLSPFAKIIGNLFGPASTTLGLAFNERVKRFTHRLRQMLEAKRLEGGESSLRLMTIVPIVQYGAMEENDELQDRWAALLANTVIGEDEPPAAPDILRQLSPLDVHFLQLCYDYVTNDSRKRAQDTQPFVLSMVEVTDILYRDWVESIGPKYGVNAPPGWRGEGIVGMTEVNCLRLGLIKEKLTGRLNPDHNYAGLMLTHLGFRFIDLCQIPKGTENG